MNNWISVLKKMPDYDEMVLWYSNDGFCFVEALDKDGNPWIFESETEGFKISGVSHWQPLPKPPTHSKEETDIWDQIIGV